MSCLPKLIIGCIINHTFFCKSLHLFTSGCSQPAVGLCRWMLLFGSGCCYFRVSFSVRVRVCCLHTYTNTHLHISSKTEIAVLRRVPHTCSPEGQISVLSPVCRSFLPSERTDDDSIRSVCIVTFFFWLLSLYWIRMQEICVTYLEGHDDHLTLLPEGLNRVFLFSPIRLSWSRNYGSYGKGQTYGGGNGVKHWLKEKIENNKYNVFF